jgi:beta-lactamase superfamily II metal-dependent hydrolase
LIERIFHTVGQGAFYSEKHENFNIVYDCGTEWKNRANKTIEKTIKQSFNKDDEIDILFISHFDYDHVSKIKTLKDHVKSIKKVVMPLLHNNEKTLLTNIYRALNFNILTLINNPQEFFGQSTQIITVIPSEDNNHERPISDDIRPLDIDNITMNQIQSGTILEKKFSTYEWIFIPYNHKYITRSNELKKALKSEGFRDVEIKKLETNSSYTLDKIINDIQISKTKGGKIFRKVYENLDGKINENSMLLYSGLNCHRKDCEKNIFLFDYSRRYFKHCEEFHHRRWYEMSIENYRVSCIYTGDTDLNVVKIKNIFRNFWKSVGTIQIPHHGDLKSFDKNVLDDKYYWCPISVGEKNSYGHPSSRVIANILSQSSIPILVTENLTSSYIEHI